MEKQKTGVEAVDRALTMLSAFSEDRSAMTLTQLAARAGLYKSTALRLSESLTRSGFLTRDADLVYRPGPELWRLGALFRDGLDLGLLVRPRLDALVAATGETASFYVRDGEARICLYRKNAPRSIRHHLEEGVRLPLDRGAAGRVLLAFSPDTDAPDQSILEVGHCVSLGERDPEVAAVASPVFNRAGALRGALSVSGALARFDEAARAKAIAALKREAGFLKEKLSGG